MWEHTSHLCLRTHLTVEIRDRRSFRPQTIICCDSVAHAAATQAGEVLLREYVFIHVERPLDKLNALIAMTGKLFTLVADLCGEDNADALSHHEVLLPGTLLSKFVSDKLAECLVIFKRQVNHPRQHSQKHIPHCPWQPCPLHSLRVAS